MSELNREEIIKALECCQFRHIKKNCDECKYHRWIEPTCRDLICQDALALIKELTEKVENYRNALGEVRVALAEANNDKKKLNEERDAFRVCAYNLQNYVNGIFEKQSQGYEPSAAKAAAEMEMWRRISYREKTLTEENERLREDNHILATEFKDNIIADTVRKMQERLQERLNRNSIFKGITMSAGETVYDVIDQIAKEMLEG